MRKKLSANFFEDEFYSPDTKTAKMEPEFIYKLQKLRNVVDVNFVISSGYRTEAYNAILGGASESYHCKGIAADIDHQGWNGEIKFKFVSAASALGFSIGIYDKHFHVDTRLGPKILWIGKSKSRKA
jgi:uncharacterized protein YcbK (DUF882 family)